MKIGQRGYITERKNVQTGKQRLSSGQFEYIGDSPGNGTVHHIFRSVAGGYLRTISSREMEHGFYTFDAQPVFTGREIRDGGSKRDASVKQVHVPPFVSGKTSGHHYGKS